MLRCAVAGEAGGILLADVRLPNLPESAPAARRVVTAVTHAWGAAAVADRAELLACELVTNATRHARDPLRSDLRLIVTRTRDRLRVEVHDPSPTPPRVRHAGPLAEGGRGLLLAETLADRLDWLPLARGKAVFVELIAWPAGDDPGGSAQHIPVTR